MALTDGCLYYYKLDEASGAILDSAGTNNGTNAGATYGVEGKIGTCLDFESTEGDGVSLDTAVAGTEDISISVWTKPESTDNFYVIVAKDSATVRSWNLGIVSNVYFQVGTVQVNDDTTTLSNGTWYHIVVTFDNSANEVKIYIGGDLKKTLTNAGTLATGNSKIYIGQREYSSSHVHYDGLIDELGIWNRVLGSDEVTTLYNGGTGITYPFTGGAAVLPCINFSGDGLNFVACEQ